MTLPVKQPVNNAKPKHTSSGGKARGRGAHTSLYLTHATVPRACPRASAGVLNLSLWRPRSPPQGKSAARPQLPGTTSRKSDSWEELSNGTSSHRGSLQGNMSSAPSQPSGGLVRFRLR